MNFIDLRSDTVTVPTNEMKKAMFDAKVGDDVYAEDPSVNELQEYAADLFYKEEALFVPSGTMGNQIGLKLNTNPGEEVIIEADAHIFFYENAAPAFISNVSLNTIPSEKGEMEIKKIKSSIKPDIYYFPTTSLICLESSHNRHGGTVLSTNYFNEVKDICTENNLRFHLDGARVWNAVTALDISLADYTAPFDTVSVCLSKGLGAPVGSILLGSKEIMRKARKYRKMLGGGMRQAGILAAAGLYAIKNNFPLMKYDHENAKEFAHLVNESEHLHCNTELVETNMVKIKYDDSINSNELVDILKKEGLLISDIGGNNLRAVFHFQISKTEMKKSADILKKVIEKFN
jgi:threonine aldolase